MQTITINPRFCGPPQSANGGYTAGRLAQLLEPHNAAIEVTLHAPPPLEEELVVDIAEDAQSLRLIGANGMVASSKTVAEMKLTLPQPVSFDAAQAIAFTSPVLRDEKTHPFPKCFVCGPARAEGDGLRLFPAQIPARNEFVAPYCPADGETGIEFVWAALDCPSSYPMYQADDPLEGPYVLGRMTAQVEGILQSGERYTVLSWRESVEGRKLLTCVAMFDEHDVAIAWARTTWIKLMTG